MQSPHRRSVQKGAEASKLTLAEPVVEMGLGVEQGGHDEMEERPEFRHVVLDGGSAQQQAVAAGKAPESFPTGAAAALDRLNPLSPTTH